VGDVEERAFLSADFEASHERADEGCFGLFVHRRGGAVFVAIEGHGSVDGGPEGLDEIVDEPKGVVPIVVVEAEGGVEAGGADGAGDDGAKDGIAVVEEAVGPAAVAVAAEAAVEEEGRPVAAGGLGLDVGGVAGADFGEKT